MMVFGILLFLAAGSPASPPAALDVEACLEPKVFTVGTYVEEPVAFESGGVRLVGRLLLPNRPGPHPGVVLIPGGGEEDRTNHPPHFVATRLARCGIAAIIYDKRGTGASAGDWASATFEDLAADAAAALHVLRRHPAVDTSRVGLIGFSQGGRLAPLVAHRTGQAAFVVTIASPFATVRETRLYAVEQAVRNLPYAPAWQDSLLALWTVYLERLEAGASTAVLDPQIERLPKHLPEVLRPGRSDAPLRGPVFNSLRFDPTAEWRTLRLPFLALFAGRDQVVPVQTSVQRLRAVGGPDSTDWLEIVIVPGVDHSFTYPGWKRQRFRFEELVAAWVMAHTGLLEECDLHLKLAAARPKTTKTKATKTDEEPLVYSLCEPATAGNE